MCDTLAVLPPAAAGGATLFAKNSDRERNEAQFLEMAPAADHADGEAVRATYIAIPQARRTHACLLSRPFWMWGAEMGANDQGLVIGNEAVHSVVPAARRRALIGMDLVRLALERAAGAAEAVEVITGLLERHGQGGDCGHLGRFYYHNSFLIADRAEAYVLETVGRQWAVERVVRTKAISNILGIGPRAQRLSRGLDEGLDFSGRFTDRERDRVTRGAERCVRAADLMAPLEGVLTPAHMMAILRDHGEAALADPAWGPAEIQGRTLCMHAGPGDRRSQTTASLVSELGPRADVHWVTGAAAPCLSLFKPVLFATGLPEQGPRPTDVCDSESLWWRHERLHRAVLADYAPRLARFAAERDALESDFASRVGHALGSDTEPSALRVVVEGCWRDAAVAEARWLAAVTAAPRAPAGHAAYRRSWGRLSTVAGFEAAT